jgi:hypothetical protein
MSRTSIVGAIAFTTLAVVLVLGTQVLGVDDKATPFVTMILGFIGLSVGQLVGTQKSEAAAEKSEAAAEQVDVLNKDLRNGTFERLLREAILKVAADQTTALEIHQETPTADKEGNTL